MDWPQPAASPWVRPRRRLIPFKSVHESRRGRWRAGRGQASPLQVRHDRYVKRQGVARLALAWLSDCLLSNWRRGLILFRVGNVAWIFGIRLIKHVRADGVS